MPVDREWLDARIERTKAMIVAHENAIEALSGGAQMYQLDTGQTRQMVTRAQLSQLQRALDSLENRLSTLYARRNGAGLHIKPGF
ncbi:MAG: hypothetical protein RLP09_32515 [Sandaracinaceae bacterium]